TYDSSNSSIFEKTTSSYDGLNRLTSATQDGATVTTLGGSPTAITSVVTKFAYDSASNLVSMQDPRGNTTNYKYDALNRRIETIAPDPGTNTIDSSLIADDPQPDVLYTYDNAGNLKSTTLQQLGGGGLVQATEYDYDSMNRIVDTKQ